MPRFSKNSFFSSDIGIDLGTSNTKAALYRTDGTLVAEASAEVALLHPKAGVVEQEAFAIHAARFGLTQQAAFKGV